MTAFAQRKALDGIRRQEHIRRLGRIIAFGGTQESKTFFGHFQPAVMNDRFALDLRLSPALNGPALLTLFALIAHLVSWVRVAPASASTSASTVLIVTAMAMVAMMAAVARPAVLTIALIVLLLIILGMIILGRIALSLSRCWSRFGI
jgi:hypothetical protein